MMLVQCPETGAQHLVETLNGYAGWIVLAEDVPPPPSGIGWHWGEHDRRWRLDAEQRLKAENLAAMSDREALLAIIEGLMAEIAELKAMLP